MSEIWKEIVESSPWKPWAETVSENGHHDCCCKTPLVDTLATGNIPVYDRIFEAVNISDFNSIFSGLGLEKTLWFCLYYAIIDEINDFEINANRFVCLRKFVLVFI